MCIRDRETIGNILTLTDLDALFLVGDTNGGVGCFDFQDIIDGKSFAYDLGEESWLIFDFDIVDLGDSIFNTTIQITNVSIV